MGQAYQASAPETEVIIRHTLQVGGDSIECTINADGSVDFVCTTEWGAGDSNSGWGASFTVRASAEQARDLWAFLMAWRPIGDDPPRDQPILVFAPGEPQHISDPLPDIACLCQWHPDAGYCVDELRHPTHWMPFVKPTE